MKPLGSLIEGLVDGLPTGAGSPLGGARVSPTDVDLTVPIESRIGAGGVLHATLPRGRMITGFVFPVGQLTIHLEAEDGA